MIKRTFWLKEIEKLFKARNIIWLHGIRRAGKTFLCRSIPDVEYYDCELPGIRAKIQSPYFLENSAGKTLALDEIHRIDNPSELLKIAADYHKDVKIIATGSSSLSAYKKFMDTLTGRKYNLKITPVNSSDMKDFGIKDLIKRMVHGGLPQFLTAVHPPQKGFAEWIDSYWAKDIAELFHIGKRDSFIKFMELLFANSGGIFEATHFAAECEVSRHTIKSYLSALDLTSVVNIVRPYAKVKNREIVTAPKIYSFDTGITYFMKGWKELRNDDCGLLWEELVLNEIISLSGGAPRYWRDKQGHEVDFIIPDSGGSAIAIECKWSAAKADFENLHIFRKMHPKGKNILAAGDCTRTYTIAGKGMKIEVAGLYDIAKYIPVMET